MITTQIAWIAVTIFVSIGLLAVGACIRSSQLSRWLRQSEKQNARLRAAMSHGSIMEALRDV